ncbi:MAG: HEAT repeat domain-containing protein [Desulfobacteraceae bacterium]|nr:HEAT repeat domain-containing protein [Desulfobacteraceae bacterium]
MRENEKSDQDTESGKSSRGILWGLLIVSLCAAGGYYLYQYSGFGPAGPSTASSSAQRFQIPKGVPGVTVSQTNTAMAENISVLEDTSRSWIDRKMALMRLEFAGPAFDYKPILAALSDDNIFIRCEAAAILGRKRVVEAQAVLETALNDKGVLFRDGRTIPAVVNTAEAALNAIKDPEFQMEVDLCAGASLASNNLDQDLALLQDPAAEAAQRGTAAGALGWTRNPRVFDALSVAISDTNVFVRAGAAEGLGNLGDERGGAPLIKALQQDAEFMVRKNAAMSLGRMQSTASVDVLTECLLMDENIFVRSACGEALGDIGDTRAIDSLKTALRDPATVSQMTEDGEMRNVRQVSEAAAEALGKMGYKVDRETMAGDFVRADILLLTSDATAIDRAQAAKRLGSVRDKDVLNELLKVLAGDKNWQVRQAVAKSLGEIGDTSAIPALKTASLNDEDPRVKNESMIALERLGIHSDESAVKGKPAVEGAATIAAGTMVSEQTPPPAPAAPTKPAPSKSPSAPETALQSPATANTSKQGKIPKLISIQADGFQPTSMVVNPGRRHILQLSTQRPGYITKIPKFNGDSQLYGRFQLGSRENNHFHFAFDRIEEPHPHLFVDVNQNGDLSDDGDSIRNTGRGVFGASVYIPFHRMADEVQLKSSYRMWVFAKDDLWRKKQLAYYSWTQFKGKINFMDKHYTAYIGDIHNNDGDYTNDGVSIDLNENGEIEFNQEYIDPGEAMGIDGQKNVFIVQW